MLASHDDLILGFSCRRSDLATKPASLKVLPARRQLSVQGNLGGMGLGLSSARRLAELMGGQADLDPAWRRGAAFYLELPAA